MMGGDSNENNLCGKEVLIERRKNMKKIIVNSIMILLFLVLISTSFDVKAEECVTENQVSVAYDSLRAKENLANEKYNKLLKAWSFNQEYVSDTYANFPEFYGGAYINFNKDLVIKVTVLNNEIEEYFAKLIDLENTEFEVVEYSYRRLIEEKDNLVDKMNSFSPNLSTLNVCGVALNVEDNALDLYIENPINSMGMSVYRKNDISCLTSFANINLYYSSEKDSVLSDVQPGNIIDDRSIGFWATKSNGVIGVVTAPHDTIYSGETIYRGGSVFGIAETPHFGGSLDAVFIRRTNTNFTPSRVPYGFSIPLRSNSCAILAVGSTVYSSGRISGGQIGTVVSTNYSASFDLSSGATITISDLGMISSTGEPGDSGGLVAGGGDASSICVVGIINARNNSNRRMTYVKATNIFSALGVYPY